MTGRSRFDPRQKQRIFPVTSMSRPTLGPTQPPVQWVPGVLSPGVKRSRCVTLTTHPIYCRGCERVGAIHPLPPSAFMACSGTALLYGHYKLRGLPNFSTFHILYPLQCRVRDEMRLSVAVSCPNTITRL
jgi:hypothetical protein